MFMGFVILFYLLFVSKISVCSSLLGTIQMLFEIILMKFDATDIYGDDAFLGPFCFTLFVFFVVFIGMTMFISIINDDFRIVRNNNQRKFNEDHDMSAFMWKKFLCWTGFYSFYSCSASYYVVIHGLKHQMFGNDMKIRSN